MTKLRHVVQLLLTTQLGNRQIAQSAGVSRTTVIRYRGIARAKQYRWNDLKDLADDDLDGRFNQAARRLARRLMPDFAIIHIELQQPGVTLQLLWEEYRAANPDNALSYSQFTEHYRRYRKTIDRVMRQSHTPGEKAFVDFSGRKPGYTDPNTGEWNPMELFVGVLGSSNLTYAVCVPQQSLPHWISAHVGMLDFFGGAPRLLVPDNLKAAIVRSGPNFIANSTYQEMAQHYGTAIIPARAYRPRDKAKVEGAVLIVQRWILARLRHRQFFSPGELNAAVAELVREFNHRPFKRLPGSRASRYEEVERTRMLPLPERPYEFGEWTGLMRVDKGYHVLVNRHWYSVPHRLVGERISARVTAAAVEIFHQNVRIASHVRDDEPGGVSTLPEHQPDAHRAYAERTPERYRQWATQVGPATAAIVLAQFDRAMPALGLPACDSLRRLVHQHGEQQVEAAATRAVEIGSLTVKSVKSLLHTQRYRRQREEEASQGELPLHSNLRGPGYYAQGSGGVPC